MDRAYVPNAYDLVVRRDDAFDGDLQVRQRRERGANVHHEPLAAVAPTGRDGRVIDHILGGAQRDSKLSYLDRLRGQQN